MAARFLIFLIPISINP